MVPAPGEGRDEVRAGVDVAQFWIDLVTGNGPPDLSTRPGRHAGPRDGWPVPTLAPDAAAGRPAEEVAAAYRDEGFEVEVHDLEDPYLLHSDLRPHRIRLLVADGRVVDATQA